MALLPVREAVRSSVIRMPSLLDLILSGLRLRLEVEIANACPAHAVNPALGAPLWCAQSCFSLNIAGQRLADCRMILGPGDAPYDLLGGVRLLEAANPDHPDHRLTLRVLAGKSNLAKKPFDSMRADSAS